MGAPRSPKVGPALRPTPVLLELRRARVQVPSNPSSASWYITLCMQPSDSYTLCMQETDGENTGASIESSRRELLQKPVVLPLEEPSEQNTPVGVVAWLENSSPIHRRSLRWQVLTVPI